MVIRLGLGRQCYMGLIYSNRISFEKKLDDENSEKNENFAKSQKNGRNASKW